MHMTIRQVPVSGQPIPEAIREAFDEVERAIENRTFPCAAVSVRHKGQTYISLSGSPEPGARPLEPGDIFDLASLTKPLATTLVALRAVEAGQLELDAPLSRYLPEAAGGTRGATIMDILSHQAGLPAIPALHAGFPDPTCIDRNVAIARLLEIPCTTDPKREVVYSCTGFMLLGLVLERLGGARLSELFDRELAGPLRLSDREDRTSNGDRASGAVATFRPREGLRARAVPVEHCAWRGRRIRGEVHDESSYCLGGDGGNAGLFANLDGVATLFGVYENGGGILMPETVAAARVPRTPQGVHRRGTGLLLHGPETFDGPLWPDDAYGHTGFTGTSVIRSPSLDLAAIVLTNRVYYGRDETAEKIMAFRRSFHAALLRPPALTAPR